jgi:hypothetical protein
LYLFCRQILGQQKEKIEADKRCAERLKTLNLWKQKFENKEKELQESKVANSLGAEEMQSKVSEVHNRSFYYTI